MGKEFEIVREGELPGTPQQVWDAVTAGAAGWLWPMEYEPRAGGAAPFGGTVLVWEPPHHLVSRAEGEGGWFNQIENIIEAREGGTTFVRYVHSGIFTDDWDSQYDGASHHTDFYLHTLRQYLLHFTGRPATWTSVDAPASSNAPGALTTVRRALGLAEDVAQDDRVRVTLPGDGPVDAVVDYVNPNFIGVRTPDVMVRVFGRNTWGSPVGVAVHDFRADADQKETEQVWQGWLERVYA